MGVNASDHGGHLSQVECLSGRGDTRAAAAAAPAAGSSSSRPRSGTARRHAYLEGQLAQKPGAVILQDRLQALRTRSARRPTEQAPSPAAHAARACNSVSSSASLAWIHTAASVAAVRTAAHAEAARADGGGRTRHSASRPARPSTTSPSWACRAPGQQRRERIAGGFR